MSMELQGNEFKKTFRRVSLVSLIWLIVSVLLFLVTDILDFFVESLKLLVVYSLIEACRVSKNRDDIRDEDVSRKANFFHAGLRFVAIMIPPVVAFACHALFLLIMFLRGYYG